MPDLSKQNDATPNVSIDAIGMINRELDAEEARRQAQQRQLQAAHMAGPTETITPWGEAHRGDLS